MDTNIQLKKEVNVSTLLDKLEKMCQHLDENRHKVIRLKDKETQVIDREKLKDLVTRKSYTFISNHIDSFIHKVDNFRGRNFNLTLDDSKKILLSYNIVEKLWSNTKLLTTSVSDKITIYKENKWNVLEEMMNKVSLNDYHTIIDEKINVVMDDENRKKFMFFQYDIIETIVCVYDTLVLIKNGKLDEDKLHTDKTLIFIEELVNLLDRICDSIITTCNSNNRPYKKR